MQNISLLLCCLPLLVIGLLVSRYGAQRFVDQMKLRRVGVTTMGHVVEAQAEDAVDGHMTSFTAIMYQTQGEVAQKLMLNAPIHLKVGASIPLIYNPRAPHEAELLPLKPAPLLLATEVLGLMFFSTVVFIVCVVI
jgi:hypothetical protein